LSIIDDGGLKVGAIVVLFIKLGDILVGENLIVESDGILIGAISPYGLIKVITFIAVDVIIKVVVLL
jgi:hypothetical protein